MNDIQLILDGIKKGDKNGGPTALAKILTESLIHCNTFDRNDLIKRYQHWWQTDAFDTGRTFAMVFNKVSQGVSISDASYEVNRKLNGATAGCGPAHRIAPLAGFNKIKTDQLIDLASQEARITHYHPYAGKCSAVMVLICRLLLEGNSWEESKDLISQNQKTKSTWLDIKNASLNNGGYVLDVMHTAIHFLDMNDSLENSLAFAGPANYCPVIVGIIENIRNKFIKKIKK